MSLASLGTGASDVSFVAVHGTGTPLGDPIEVSALGHALAGGGGQAVLGSVKACYGHTEGAAGLTGAFPFRSCVPCLFLLPLCSVAIKSPVVGGIINLVG